MHQARDGIAQRGLAHAVAAHDAQHAVFNSQADALQGVGAAVVNVQPFDGQGRGFGGSFVFAALRLVTPGHQCLLPM